MGLNKKELSSPQFMEQRGCRRVQGGWAASFAYLGSSSISKQVWTLRVAGHRFCLNAGLMNLKREGTRTAGSQCEESHPWQGHEEGSWHTQGVLRLQGPLWKFLSMYPNKNLPAFVLCFSTLLTFSGKSQFRALVFCIWKSVSIQTPLWWLSSLPAGLVQLRLWLFEASWPQEAQEA